jgi:hypothetical protein
MCCIFVCLFDKSVVFFLFVIVLFLFLR